MNTADLNSKPYPQKQILILNSENIGKQLQNNNKIRKSASIKIIRQYQSNHYDQKLQKVFNIQSKLQYALFYNKNCQKNIYFSLPQQLDSNQEIQEQLKTLNEQVKRDCEDNRYEKYHNSIKWLTELWNNQYDDFLLQLNSLRQYKEQIKSGFFSDKDEKQQSFPDFAILFQQNLNQNCNTLLHVCSVIHKLEELQFAQLGKPFQSTHNVYYINLTFKNSQSDLQFWSYMNQKQKQYNKFITLQIVNQGESLKSNTSSEIIIPLIAPQNKCYSKQQFQIIYNHLISPHLICDNERILYVEISPSDIKIDYEAYEYIFNKFSQLGQVIVLVKIPQKVNYQEDNQEPVMDLNKEEIELEYELFSIVNACVLGLQGIKKQEALQINQDKLSNLISWLQNMQVLYQRKNQTIENLLLQETLLISSHENEIQNDNFYSFYSIFQSKAKWTTPKNQNGQIISFSSFSIFHQTQTIVLYDKDPYQNSFERAVNDQAYSQINLQVNNLKDSSIIIINNFMIFAYGFQSQGRQEFENIVQVYDIQTKLDFVLRREEFEINYNLKYFKKESQEDIIKRISCRIGQQICVNNGFQQQDDKLSIILFGGEDFKSNKIMNIIEFIFINLKTKQFFSRIIDTQKLFVTTSLRPWPNQIILDAVYQNNQFFLALCGNQSNKFNYYSFPINLNHKEYAQLFVLTEHKLNLYEIKIDRSKSQIQDIESLLDNSRNWWLFEESDNYLLWKILITRTIKFKKLNQGALNYFKDKFNINVNQQSNVCFEIIVKLNIPKKEDYKNCTIDQNCEIRSIKKTE